MAQLLGYLASFDDTNSEYDSVESSYPFSNVFGQDANGSKYAQWNITKGSAVQSAVYYHFDCSSIPQNAVINKVSCVARAMRSTTQAFYFSSLSIRMVIGIESTEDTYVQFDGTAETKDIPCDTSFTRKQLDNIGIKINSARGMLGTSNKYYVRFYGATLTVEYEDPTTGESIMIKSEGVWQQCSQIFKKINGVWVEQSDLENVFDDNTTYVIGKE